MFRLKNDPRYENVTSSIAEIFLSSSIREISSLREVANIVHALAKLNEPITFILDRVEEESGWIISNGEPQSISNIAWAFAELNIRAPKFFDYIEKFAPQIINNAKPQEISNTAWAFTKFSIAAPNFFKLTNENASKIIKMEIHKLFQTLLGLLLNCLFKRRISLNW